MQHLTLLEVSQIFQRRGQLLTLSYSHGQYHAYAFQDGAMKGYERDDNFCAAIERIVQEPGSSPSHPPIAEAAPHG